MNENQNAKPVRANVYVLSLFLIVALSTSAEAFDSDKFYQQVSESSAAYEEFIARDENHRLAVEGNISESNRRLQQLVPTKNKTFYDFFVLGNMLFKLDWNSSKAYMKEAEQLEPDNPMVLYERGIHEHKSNNFKDASNYYRRFHQTDIGTSNPISWAYLTHAYLMSGEVEQAFDAWKNAQFSKNHTAIEKGMYTLFSFDNPERTRERLVSDIKEGRLSKLCDLWELDSNWEIDWWNHQAKKEYLAYDLEFANRILEKGSLEEMYFEFCRSSKALSDDDYLAKLKTLDILEGKRHLPASSAFIYKILQRLMSSKLMEPAEFLDAFEAQIRLYAEQNPLDQKYYEILAFLYVNSGNRGKLQEIDLYGWEKLKSEKFASSYIAGLDPKSESYDRLLNKALADFPHSVSLNQFKLTDSSENPLPSLAKFVAAQFANVKNNWSGPYRLHDYMASLKHQYDKLYN